MLTALIGLLVIVVLAFALSYLLPLGKATSLPSDFEVSIQESDLIEDPRMVGLSEQVNPVKHAANELAKKIERDMFLGPRNPVSDAEIHGKDFPELFKAVKKGGYKAPKKRPVRKPAKKKSKKKK